MDFKAPLKFFNLLDRGNKVSITNLALYVLLVKIAFMPTLSLPDVAAFFMVLLNYGHKRIESAKAEARAEQPSPNPLVEDMKSKIDEVESKVSALALQAGIRSLNNDRK